eukprot:93108_1
MTTLIVYAVISFAITTIYGAASNPLPGVQRIAQGYNIILGNPKATNGKFDPGLLNTIFNTNNFTDGNFATMAEKTYDVPNGIHALGGDTCSKDWDFNTITGTSSYSSMLSESVSVSGFFGYGSFSASQSYQTVYETTNKHDNVMTSTQLNCSVYSAQLNGPYDFPYFDINFLDLIIYQMPTKYDPNNKTITEWFNNTWFNTYGTHYISQMTAGGIAGQYASLSYYAYSSYYSSNFSIYASAEFLASEVGGVDLTTDYATSLSQKWKSVLIDFKEFSIGAALPSSGKTGDWLQSIYESPLPISLKLTPIYDLLSNYMLFQRQNAAISQAELQQKYIALKNATIDYCNVYAKSVPNKYINCNDLPPDNGLPGKSVFGGLYCSVESDYDGHYCNDPYTTPAGNSPGAFNCKQGYDPHPYFGWNADRWYYCLDSKCIKNGVYYDPMEFFGGIYTLRTNGDGIVIGCQYNNSFSLNGCSCPDGFTGYEFGRQIAGDHTDYDNFWCYNQTSWKENNNMGIIGGFIQTGHHVVINQFTLTTSCPNGFTAYFIAYWNCDAPVHGYCARYICISNIYPIEASHLSFISTH